MKIYLTGILTSLIFYSASVHATTIKTAHLEKDGTVHVTSSDRRIKKIPSPGTAYELQISHDRQNVAWLVKRGKLSAKRDHVNLPESSELMLYRKGRLRVIECTQLIRSFWFTRDRRHIAMDCGPRHFAGREELYDIDTLRLVDSFDQSDVPLEKRPNWSKEAK